MAKKNQAANDIKDFTKKLKDFVGRGGMLSKKELTALGLHAIYLIVKRTRLGYGVRDNGGDRYKLPKLSTNYKTRRKDFADLASSTAPGKSNLTLTGQMLGSMKILGYKQNSVQVGPQGSRRGSPRSNDEIARFNAEKGRVFNNLSRLEYEQLIRFFRNRFGDLAKRNDLDYKG